MKHRSDAADLAARLTQWNLGVLVALSLAFGGALWSVKSEVAEVKKQVVATNNILAWALGLTPKEAPSESRSNRRAYPEARAAVAEVPAAAEADSVAGRAGADPARGGGSTPQTEGRLDVSF